MLPLRTKIDLGINEDLKPDCFSTKAIGILTSQHSVEKLPDYPYKTTGKIVVQSDSYVNLRDKKEVDEGCSVLELEAPLVAQLPNFMEEFVKYSCLLYLPPDYYLPPHIDDSRECSLYFPLYPKENYAPISYEEAEAGNEGVVWLIDQQEWHWVDNTGGDHRYNFQVILNKPVREIKEVLEKNNLI